MYTDEQHELLLSIARQAIKKALSHDAADIIPSTDDIELQQLRGAFVTLHTQDDSLRGCIGIIEPVAPLVETIAYAAVSAALRDPRFPPVNLWELNNLTIEISVLSPLQPAKPDEVVVGTHGLVVEQGEHRGLLLPQVATEWGWTREQFLDHTCSKAGLPASAWRNGAKLSTFTAEVFSEK